MGVCVCARTRTHTDMVGCPRRETGPAFLTDEKPFWPKPFRDLSLGRIPALKQVLVIGLKGKGMQKPALLSGERSSSREGGTPAAKTLGSVSLVTTSPRSQPPDLLDGRGGGDLLRPS